MCMLSQSLAFLRSAKYKIAFVHLVNQFYSQTAYLRELSELGQMIKMPEVLLEIYNDVNDLRIEYPNTYREFNYTIINDKTFERCHISNKQ